MPQLPPNVRPFRRPGNSRPGGASWLASPWSSRAIAAVVYLLMGAGFRVPMDIHISILLVLGLLYWALIHQKRHQFDYALRFHLLQALLTTVALVYLNLLVTTALQFLFITLRLVGLGTVVMPVFEIVMTGFVGGFAVGFLALMMVLAILALMNRQKALPVIGHQVRIWA